MSNLLFYCKLHLGRIWWHQGKTGLLLAHKACILPRCTSLIHRVHTLAFVSLHFVSFLYEICLLVVQSFAATLALTSLSWTWWQHRLPTIHLCFLHTKVFYIHTLWVYFLKLSLVLWQRGGFFSVSKIWTLFLNLTFQAQNSDFCPGICFLCCILFIALLAYNAVIMVKTGATNKFNSTRKFFIVRFLFHFLSITEKKTWKPICLNILLVQYELERSRNYLT